MKARFDNKLEAIRVCHAAGKKVMVMIGEGVYAEYAQSQREELWTLGLELVCGPAAVSGTPDLLDKKHRFCFGPVRDLPKVEPYTDMDQGKPYGQKLRFSKKDRWVIALPPVDSATKYPKGRCFRFYLDTSLMPRAIDIASAADSIEAHIEIVTVGEVEREVEANYDWDVERAGLKRAKERIGGRWKTCPSPQQTKWQLRFYEVSGKNVEAHGDHLIVNEIAQHIMKHSSGDDLNVVLSSDRVFEGEYRRMEMPRQRVVSPKLSPTPSDGRITLLDVGRKAIRTPKSVIYKRILHYAIQNDNKRRAREPKEATEGWQRSWRSRKGQEGQEGNSEWACAPRVMAGVPTGDPIGNGERYKMESSRTIWASNTLTF